MNGFFLTFPALLLLVTSAPASFPEFVADVFPAKPTSSASAPCVILVHGGGWTQGSPELLAPFAKRIADRGVCAVLVRYRLADGEQIFLTDSAGDVAEAVNFVFENAAALRVDPAKIFLLGESAGGHLSALAVQNQKIAGTLSGLILVNPVLDMVATPWVRKNKGIPRDNDAKTAPTEELLRSLSPVSLPLQNLPPVFLLHGKNDSVVPASQSEQLHSLLLSEEKASSIKVYEDTGHAFLIPGYGSPEQISRAETDMIRWLLEQSSPDREVSVSP